VNHSWEGDQETADAETTRTESERSAFLAQAEGEPISIGNEFAEIRVTKVQTRNGARLLIESPRSGQWFTLDPLELESLTWQNATTFSEMIGHPFTPLFQEEPT
jgi:hypothetical protein